MKYHIDKSIGIVTLMKEHLTKTNPTDLLRFVNHTVHRKREKNILNNRQSENKREYIYVGVGGMKD